MSNSTNGLLDPDMSSQHIRLRMGELNASEVRLVRAAIKWVNAHAMRENERLRLALEHYKAADDGVYQMLAGFKATKNMCDPNSIAGRALAKASEQPVEATYSEREKEIHMNGYEKGARDAFLKRESVTHYLEALTPSAATKCAYAGEFQFSEERHAYDGSGNLESYTHRNSVPWTTIKEIMAAIKSRAENRALGEVLADELKRNGIEGDN